MNGEMVGGDGKREVVVAAVPPIGVDASSAPADLERFVELHYERLTGLARLICRDSGDAADAVQVGLEVAWRRRATLRDPERLRPWLDRIVVREATRVARSRRSWIGRLLHPDASVAWIEPAHDDQPRIAIRHELARAFAKLSPEQRTVVALHLHLGYSVAETADIVGAPIETVRSRLRLARERLRRSLEEPVS
jgi:RNA polymerase sigma-70 factor (ECF subfamily)